ncbi:MAG: flagellar biosynthesis anti-sigma factor FlgM [Candidatus Velthaea sp.]
MIISRTEIESVVSAYRATVKRKSRTGSVTSDSNRYEPSEGTSTPADAFTFTLGEPMYRADVVADLQRRITEGKYYVPSDQIIEKLLGRLVAQAL